MSYASQNVRCMLQAGEAAFPISIVKRYFKGKEYFCETTLNVFKAKQ